jgi:thioester reductase-like protein
MSVLLTGATGFVGMEVLARLLEEDGDEPIFALVRAPDELDAQPRLNAVLDGLGVAPAGRARARAVPGDLSAPNLRLTALARRRLVNEVTAIVHCAASVQFGLPLDEARSINVAGTRRVIGLAREIAAHGRLERLVHVSTAYVAGLHRGRFFETDLDVGQAFRNTYERTKAEAERVVRAEAVGLPTVVVRPSIVVGESDTGWTPAFNVLYWPLQAFARGLIKALPARPDGVVDVVPVDYVADAIFHLLRDRPDVEGVIHATAGAEAVTIEELVELSCAALHRERPPIDPGAAAALAERSDQAARYLPYFDVGVTFDATRAREVLDPVGITPPPLESYFDTLLGFAQAARWGKRPIARADASVVGAQGRG